MVPSVLGLSFSLAHLQKGEEETGMRAAAQRACWESWGEARRHRLRRQEEHPGPRRSWQRIGRDPIREGGRRAQEQGPALSGLSALTTAEAPNAAGHHVFPTPGCTWCEQTGLQDARVVCKQTDLWSQRLPSSLQ